ncbi:AAA family ATPase [Ammoniphilus oxalaticus]|uniref:AAA family ATPase n=1 Tax=Ammoniphilus oxalaticus TaxID=66863 RepID=A0A419SIX0_9BACL|nr:replication-associated recombination protein A [Ammoniphilus oxalaticus]RKD23935.1 AAA family ATPase [Ammoniphilus oxalaticus]
MDLFSFEYDNNNQGEQRLQPLAARMRPKTIDQFVGQEQIVGKGKLLRRAIEADQISSLIFYGPPGTGKTTLAKVIAGATQTFFTELNAVTAGVADIRKVIEQAKETYLMSRRRTILFIDEIHRFNKAQQDALLPYVEEGTIILIGATTENPYFEVNAALLSRSQVFQLELLSNEHLAIILDATLNDVQDGYGELKIKISEEAREHLLQYSSGDARRLLNALELAVTTTVPNAEQVIEIDLQVAMESIQRRAVRYDKSGDAHYDTVSAFIKSIRGSDPDAALFWLAQMIEAGEDPLFIARRVVIAASEDIGNADPMALSIAVSAFQALQFLGMPEGRIPLAQAVTYCASAPKSNASYKGINEAMSWVKNNGQQPVPNHLKDAHYKGAAKLGRGQGYLYPHHFPENVVEQQYLPDGVSEQFYRPTENGHEQKISMYLKRVDTGKKGL